MQSELSSVVKDHPYGWLLQDFLTRFRSADFLGDTDIPYLVAVGEKGCGKSSLLADLSGIPFPAGINRTQIATEVVLRRSRRSGATAAIIPLESEIKSEAQDDIRINPVELPAIPSLIDEAKRFMRLSDGDDIGEGILRVEISGPNLPHLALIDLPGMTDDLSKAIIINKLVKRYLSHDMTVILNVLPASEILSDSGARGLIQTADPLGNRTINIIVEPEKLPSGTHAAYVMPLFQLRATMHGSLSWHVHRYPPASSKITLPAEISSFLRPLPWRDLPEVDVGISHLRVKLLDLLEAQFLASFPRLLRQTQMKLAHYRAEMSNVCSEPRRYLTGLSEKFQALTKEAVSGEYHDLFFHSGNLSARRLRNTIDRETGYFRDCLTKADHDIRLLDDNSRSSTALSLPVSREKLEFIYQIEYLLERGPGQHVSEIYCLQLVEKLVALQSIHWGPAAKEYIVKPFDAVVAFLRNLVNHIAIPQLAEGILNSVLDPVMKSKINALHQKVEELVASRCQTQLVTLNEEFMRELDGLQKCLNKQGDHDRRHVIVPSLLRCSQLYYRTCLQAFLENVEKLAVEGCLLNDLHETLSSSWSSEIDLDLLKQLLRHSFSGLSKKIIMTEFEVALIQCRSEGMRFSQGWKFSPGDTRGPCTRFDNPRQRSLY